MSSALLFPGQGPQKPGMLHRLPPGEATERTLAQAAEVLGGPGVDALDSADALNGEVGIQLSLLIAGTAVARALAAAGVRWDYVAGHSIGAFTAAVAAEALSLTDALRLVRLRAQLMAELFPPELGFGMVALTGLGESEVEELAGRVRAETGEAAYAANVNAPDQIVVSGSGTALDRLVALARPLGVRRSVRLSVPVPSHCPLTQPVADRLAGELASLQEAGRLTNPRMPAVGDADARLLRTADALALDLARSVAVPVRWHDMTTALYERDVRLFVEAPPGRGLTRLAAAAFPDARAYAVGESGLDSAVFLLHRARSAGVPEKESA